MTRVILNFDVGRGVIKIREKVSVRNINLTRVECLLVQQLSEQLSSYFSNILVPIDHFVKVLTTGINDIIR